MSNNTKTTINITPSWSQTLRVCLTLLEAGNNEGKKEAHLELKRMANTADIAVDSEKKRLAINKTLPSLKAILEHLWKDEMADFTNTYEVVIQSNDTLEPWIEVCEQNSWTTHNFYHLMILKKQFNIEQ